MSGSALRLRQNAMVCTVTPIGRRVNLPDHALGHKYNLFEQNVECARFIRRAWEEVKALHAAGLI